MHIIKDSEIKETSMGKKRSKQSKKRRNEIRRRRNLVESTEKEYIPSTPKVVESNEPFFDLSTLNPEFLQKGIWIMDEDFAIDNALTKLGAMVCYKKYESEAAEKKAILDVETRIDNLDKEIEDFKERYHDELYSLPDFFSHVINQDFAGEDSEAYYDYILGLTGTGSHTIHLRGELNLIKEGKVEPAEEDEFEDWELYEHTLS